MKFVGNVAEIDGNVIKLDMDENVMKKAASGWKYQN